MIKEQINVLINLAASDSKVADKEAKTIYMIAKANGMAKEEVDALLKNPKPIVRGGGRSRQSGMNGYFKTTCIFHFSSEILLTNY